MLKKLFLWSLYAAFVGILLAGAVNRTNAKLSDTEPTRNGNDQAISASVSDEGVLALPEHDAQPGRERVILNGQVISVTTKEMIVRLDDGQMIGVYRRAWRFAQELGFSAQAGDFVQLEGFYDGSTFEVTQMTNSSNGLVAIIRDEDGHPLWSGE